MIKNNLILKKDQQSQDGFLEIRVCNTSDMKASKMIKMQNLIYYTLGRSKLLSDNKALMGIATCLVSLAMGIC